ncbi:methyltransferase [Pseudomonas tohonis]|uniref:Methyltransferase n=1 Tax=Pseudomonas tohonis TaxID=2725477 RepID=A0A6J4E6G3_9PSED|nr:class I SAM-dependent methyltransferase [Pseudomonas tohonis]BCG25038.1 methyltransferase [Pseudomonas tohonis]GJN55984.1 methyltransferase [Pseudomonas tohonis]
MSVADTYFDKLYHDSRDPWAFRRRWYEKRKRSLVLAALPRGFYDRVFEPGCSSGELSLRLADRCHDLLCCDTSARAVELAAQRLANKPNVRLLQARLPQQWPGGRFDLIILSELCYYLDADDLDRLIAHCLESLNRSGTLLACHWRPEIDGCPLTGDQVHERLARGLGMPRLLRHEEPDLLLEVWCHDATSVAEREGLREHGA